VTTDRPLAPWSPWIGVARTLLAASMLLTLVLTPFEVLFAGLATGLARGQCEGIRGISLFCLTGPGSVWLAYAVSLVVLAVVASGFWPAITAIPFAYVAFSVVSAGTLIDGGDQVVQVLSLILVPYSLCDRRRSVWSRPRTDKDRPITNTIASVTSQVIRLQVSLIYIVACVSKLATDAWPDGSAIYYWFRHPNFGSPEWLQPILFPVTTVPVLSAAASWGSLLLEFSLGISLLLPRRVRLDILLPTGVAFHTGILLAMGISSFSIAMIGALVILLVPSDASWSEIGDRWYGRPVRKLFARPTSIRPSREEADVH
jgi:antimicrobial peptide system SdpB family protein